MEQLQLLPEFISNHIILAGAFLVVLAMLVKSEFEHQTSRNFQLEPVNATRAMNNSNTVVIDVRSDKEFADAHIKGAKHIAMSALQDKIKNLSIDKNDTILVYCNTGNQSNKACRMLIREGYSNTKNLKGGIVAWKDANLPVSKK